MRLWSIHPKYVDSKGLVALWRETLLAQKVLSGLTRGYKNHPQLDRFKNYVDPAAAIGSYLKYVYEESQLRNYNFNYEKIVKPENLRTIIPVTDGQLEYEYEFLKKKLLVRDSEKHENISKISDIECNPVFRIIEGEIEPWEKV